MIVYNWESPTLLHIHFMGSIDVEEMVTACHNMSEDVRFQQTTCVIGNWIQCDVHTLNADNLVGFVDCLIGIAETNGNIKNASVHNVSESDAKLVKIYQEIGKQLPWEIEIFHSVGQAKQWLMTPTLMIVNN